MMKNYINYCENKSKTFYYNIKCLVALLSTCAEFLLSSFFSDE